jgi:hypothetical protein
MLPPNNTGLSLVELMRRVVCARAQFEVLDVAEGRDPALVARLAKGMFAKPGVYPAIVRFGNADSKKNSDFKADVRFVVFLCRPQS